MKDQLIEKIKQIIADEKFKMDAFFLCGAATSAPIQSLQKACEQYLQAVDKGEPTKEAAEILASELQAAIEKRSRITIKGDLANNIADLEWVYQNREFL